MRRVGIVRTAAAVVAIVGTFNGAPAQKASDREELVLGMSTALTGPTAGLGTSMKGGLDAAIAEFNTDHSNKKFSLRLLALDDGYEPAQTAPNMRRLIEQEQVLAVVGNVGTPTAVAAVPIAVETQTPFIGAFTGAGVLRKSPPDRVVINFRASYAQETGAMVDALIIEGGLKPEQVALFTQRDAFGDSGFTGAAGALRRHGLADAGAIPHGRYERNTVAVENGLADILDAPTPPAAIIMVGTYKPCAAFVKLARESGYTGRILAVSFVGAANLVSEAGSTAEGVIVTQVVPHPDSALPIAGEFRAAAKTAGVTPDFVAFEGYVVGRMIALGLKGAARPVTRDGLIGALEHLGTFDLGMGTPLTLGTGDHQACDTVWPTVIREGKVVPFAWEQLGGSETAAADEK